MVCLILLGIWLAKNPPKCHVKRTGKTIHLEGLSLYEGRTERKLYYFYQSNCGACKEFEHQWKMIVRALRGSEIGAIPVNTNTPDNLPLVSYYNITETPTFILVIGTHSVEYTGPAKADDILEFAKGNV
tara:strand:+ start:273 stop:659 length:387 start_codon:yes stop_codon:yes gene_type:complete